MEKEDNKRDRWLTVEEENRLLNSCAPWLLDLVLFALHTGMRMGEILDLSWRGIDFDRRTVTVFHSKNGERRTIPAPSLQVGARQGQDRRFPFPRHAPHVCDPTRASRGGRLQSPTSARA